MSPHPTPTPTPPPHNTRRLQTKENLGGVGGVGAEALNTNERTDRQADRQTDRQTSRERDLQISSSIVKSVLCVWLYIMLVFLNNDF